jgi:hypothetical protein
VPLLAKKEEFEADKRQYVSYEEQSRFAYILGYIKYLDHHYSFKLGWMENTFLNWFLGFWGWIFNRA